MHFSHFEIHNLQCARNGLCHTCCIYWNNNIRNNKKLHIKRCTRKEIQTARIKMSRTVQFIFCASTATDSITYHNCVDETNRTEQKMRRHMQSNNLNAKHVSSFIRNAISMKGFILNITIDTAPYRNDGQTNKF